MPTDNLKLEPDDILTHCVKNFEEAEQASANARGDAEIWRDYFDGKQWTSEEISELTKRKQPPITDNMLKDKLEYIVGLEVSSRRDPKAYPRTPSDENAAEAATDALRFVGENNDFDMTRSEVAENMFIEGFGGVEVTVIRKGENAEIEILHNRWDRCFYDPHSRNKDFSDAKYLGTFLWLDLDDAENQYPNVNWESVRESVRHSAYGNTFDDKPSVNWTNANRNRVRIVEQYFYQEGRWKTCKFLKDEWVEEPKDSSYLDENGDTQHPYSWISAYIDREGNRYGVAKRYKDLQDEINHRRSRSLFLLNTNQVIMENGAADDVNLIRREANKPDGVLVHNPGFQFTLEKNTELAIGQAQLLEQAQVRLARTGPKAVTNVSASASGRAKQIDQQADVIELGRLLDQLRHFQRQTYRKVWGCVRQFWTEARWVRVRDDAGAPKYIQLNGPITALEDAEAAFAEGNLQPEQMALAASNPNRIVRVENSVGELDVDIIIDDAPDILTVQQEQFANLVSLASAGIVFPPELYIEASSLRNKDRLLEKLSGGDDPEAQQAIQQERQLSTAERVAKLQKDTAQARKTDAEASETELEVAIATAAAAGVAAGNGMDF